MGNFNKKILVCTVLLIFLCMPQLIKRINTEKNKTIEICLDFADLEEFATQINKNTFDLLKQFRDVGVTSVSFQEDTLQQLQEDLELKIYSAMEARKLFWVNVNDDEFLVAGQNKEILQRIFNYFSFKSKKSLVSKNVEGVFQPTSPKNKGGYVIPKQYFFFLILKGNVKILQNIGVGFSTEKIKKAKELGLNVNFRISNESFLNKKNLNDYLNEINNLNNIRGKIYVGSGWEEKNSATLIFSQDSVLGYPYLLKDAGQEMLKYNFRFGLVEFAKQKGENELGFAVRPNLIRVHSIKKEELDKFTPPVILDRVLRAVNERKIVFLYLRAIPIKVGKNSLKINFNFYKKIKISLLKSGFLIGPASPIADISLSPYIFAVSTLILIFMWFLLLSKFIVLPEKIPPLSLMLLIFFWFLIIQMFFLSQTFTVRLIAFLVALTFPLFSFIFAKEETEDELIQGLYLIAVFKVIKVCLITLAGGLIIAALLSDWTFENGLNLFAGVKFSFLLPLVIILSAYFLNFYPQKNENLKQQLHRTYKNLFNILNLNIKLFWAAGFLIFAGVLIAMLLRTGNDPQALVSPLELKFRSLLEKFLIVRPRTKEFLIGHPFLFLYFLFLKQKKQKIFPFLVVGVIGQLSLLNSFCHIHSPLLLAIFRTFQGIWIGIIMGAVYYFLINLILKTHHWLVQEEVRS